MERFTLHNHSTQIAALIGSRICHDLISPIGAIGNGLELLEMTQDSRSAEIELIGESQRNAQARIRFFRVAFGAAPPNKNLTKQELDYILSDIGSGRRHLIDCLIDQDIARQDARLCFLAIMCIENALPKGGRITLGRRGQTFVITGHAPTLTVAPALWQALETTDTSVAPAEVQFALLPLLLDELGKRPSYAVEGDHVRIWF